MSTSDWEVKRRKGLFLIERSASPQSNFGRVAFEEQPGPQKVFTAIYELVSEVENGGFWQYFANSSAETAHFVVEALEIISALRTAEVCRQAIAVAFPAGLPEDYAEIRAAAHAQTGCQDKNFPTARDISGFTKEMMDQLDESFNAFMQCPDDLDGLLFAYVQKYPDEFGPTRFD